MVYGVGWLVNVKFWGLKIGIGSCVGLLGFI